MRDVLVVLFWLWLLAALGVYAYRIYRRVTQGPKAERAARAQGDAPHEPGSDPGPGSAAAPRRSFRKAEPPPLPDGPIEARLPRSLQGLAPEAATAPAGTADPVPPPAPRAGTDPLAASPPRPAPTLAEAVAGIRMPDALLPVVDAGPTGVDDGRVARFSGTGTTVAEVADALAAELRRLDYDVDGLDTVTPSRAGLSARRDDAAVAAAIELDQETGAVTLQLRT